MEKTETIIDNKLVLILKQLDTSLQKQFGLFVDSPYFNKHKNMRQLLKLLLAEAPKFKAEKLGKQLLFKAVFPEQSYQPQKISDLLTYLFRLFGQFASIHEFQQDKNQQSVNRLKFYQQKGFEKHFGKTMGKLDLNKKQPKGSMAEKLAFVYETEKMKSVHAASLQSRTSGKEIERETIALDEFYLVAKLKNACEMINRQNIVKEEFQVHLLDEIRLFIANAPEAIREHPGIQTYHAVLNTLLFPEEEAYYDELIKVIDAQQDHFHVDELRTIYDYAQNYCIMKINQGRVEYGQKLLKLYKLLIINKVIFYEDLLSPWDYKNTYHLPDPSALGLG